MEEVWALRERVKSHNSHATPQDKIHFKNFFFFCRRIGAPSDDKRPKLGQRLCHRATEKIGEKGNPIDLSGFPLCLLCLRWLLCDTPNIPNGRAGVGTTSAWKS